jgi:hypothetical protein
MGFTLIELLLSLSIMMLVLITSMYGYRLYVDAWGRRLSNVEQSFELYQKLYLVSGALKGVTPYLVRDQSLDRFGFYFLGRSEGFTAVTHNPVFNPGYPAVIRVFRETDANGNYQLVYEEASLKNSLLISADQELPFAHRTIILENITTLKFRYYGVDGERNSEMFEGTRSKSWLQSYDGMEIIYQPEIIEITIDDFIYPVNLPQRSDSVLSQTAEPV